jgi:type II secretory pathway component PulF
MATSWLSRPGVAFAWITIELIAFSALMLIATLWVPQVEQAFREAGATLSAPVMRCIAGSRCLAAYGWLLVPAVLVSLFVKAGVVRAQPAKAGSVALSAVVMALVFLGIALAMVGILTTAAHDLAAK